MRGKISDTLYALWVVVTGLLWLISWCVADRLISWLGYRKLASYARWRRP